MVALALRAGKNRVVVGDDQAAGALHPEKIAVHRGEPRHDAVARRIADEILLRATRRLRRDGERSEFDETVGIDERGDVLARRAMIGLAPPGDRLRAIRVESKSLTRQHVGEILANGVRVDRLGSHLGPGAGVGRLDEQDDIVLVERIALPPAQLAHDPAAGRADQMLHLHRFDHGDLLAGAHGLALGDVNRNEGAGDRRADRDRAFRPLERDRLAIRRAFGGGVEIEAPMVMRRRLQKLRQAAFDEARVDSAGDEIGMPQKRLQEGNIGFDAGDAELAERPRRLRRRGRKACRRRVDDQLGDKGIEGRGGAIAGIAEPIDAHARAGGNVEGGDAPPAGRGLAGSRHDLEIDPRLDRMALRGMRSRKADRPEAVAGSDADLGLHEVDAEDFLGDRVLDLQARVGLDEGEPGVVGVVRGVEQELESAEVVDACGGGEPHGRAGYALA